MKVKLIELANELEMEFSDLFEQAKEKLTSEQLTGRGKNTWVTPEGAEELRLNADMPEVVPEVYKAKVLHTAPNGRWVYCTIDGLAGKHPVLVGRRLSGDTLVGKPIEIHRIEDATGVTFRHASLTS